MCHRRGEWSRTSSRASEPEDVPETESWWGTRARDRLVAFLSTEEEADPTPAETSERPTSERPTPNRPASEPKPTATTTEIEEEAEEADEEREEEPIPADD